VTRPQGPSAQARDLHVREVLERTSVAEGLREIKEIGLEHHLLHLAIDMAPPQARKPCPECGRQP
jgi:hypothetical protein